MQWKGAGGSGGAGGGHAGGAHDAAAGADRDAQPIFHAYSRPAPDPALPRPPQPVVAGSGASGAGQSSAEQQVAGMMESKRLAIQRKRRMVVSCVSARLQPRLSAPSHAARPCL